MKKIKVFGERNTGTNYLVQMLAKNCRVELFPSVVPTRLPLRQKEWMKDLFFALAFQRTLGWKHARPDLEKIRKHPDLDRTSIITLSKNPYSFLLSLYKRPYHYKGEKPDTFSAFLQAPWRVRGRDNHADKQFPSPMALWNAKNQGYMELKQALGEKVINLKYESLIDDPVKMVQDLADQLDLELRGTGIRNVEQSAKGEKKGFADYRAYYLGEEWRAKLSPEEIQLINAALDPRVMAFFDYEFID